MQKELVSVVIPIYKESLSSNEKASLEQCCRILSNYPIVLVCPEDLNLSEYEIYFEKYEISPRYLNFDNCYFQGVEGYNELLLTKVFYSSFENYQFILIYQLDAFVFSDQLEYWCRKNYDYIGAPWFRKIWRFGYTKKLASVGNGGFSLRKVDSCIRVLEYEGKFKPLRYFFTWNNSVALKLRKMKWSKRKNIKWSNTVQFFLQINKKTEDQFWSLDTRESYADFTVAPIDDAIRFSFECNPSYLFQLTGGQLPFGCHAWDRYEPRFWYPIIEEAKTLNNNFQ